MKNTFQWNLIFAIMISLTLIGFQHTNALSSALYQTNQTVQVTGQACDPGGCGTINFTFPLDGGQVQGTFHLTYPAMGEKITESSDTYVEIGTTDRTGTLSGTFSGGAGGRITGTFTAHETLTVNSSCENCSNQSWDYSGPWEGQLNSDGTGSGTINKLLINWNVSFPADAFSSSTDPTESLQPAPTLAAGSDSQMDTGDPALVWNTSITERMHGWVEIDQAIAEMLGQDSALIARDVDGTFYVVDNQGNRKPIPAEIVDALQISDNFALLSNRNLLENNPTVKALIAKEGAGVLNATDGTGDLAFYSPPDWLKQRQYMWLMTQCEQGVCSGYTKISIFKSSGYINMNALASSEHSSVRGTINGGGDFIYEPSPYAVGSFLFSILIPAPISAYPPYLGVLVTNKSDGAEIVKIQPGSPAAGVDLQVGDLIANVDGTALDDQHTLQTVLSQFRGGDEIVLGILRNGNIMAPNLTLAAWIPNVIETPSAWIMVSDQTELVYDIGLNGITAVYVISDKALVHEPETKTEVEVPAGMALIIVPGESVGEPFAVSDQDLNTWWKNPSVSDAATGSTLNAIQGKDFNPVPGVDGGTLYWGGWFIIAILYLVIFIVKLVKNP